MLDRLKTLVRIAARMTKMPMENMTIKMAFCLQGAFIRVMRGSGIKSMSVSEEMLKQAWTIA